MRKIFSFLLVFLVLHHFAFAQGSCNDDIIINTEGHWNKVSDASPFPDQNFPKTQFPQVTIRCDKMQKLLQSAYPKPKGIEAKWYRGISGDALVKDGPVPYELEALFPAYFCNTYTKKIELGDETNTWCYVWANQFNWFAEYIKIYTIHKLPVYLLNKKVGIINGYPVYEGYNNGKPDPASIHNRAVILTRPGQSPYRPVTQKQFLKAFINYHEKRDLKLLAKMEKNTAESIAKSKKFNEDELMPTRILLADSLNTDLEQPAILSYDNMLEFKKFTTEEMGGQQLVRLNPDYFNMTLPKYIPQLLIVYWSWGMGKAEQNFKKEMEANFNFNALKEMLDK